MALLRQFQEFLISEYEQGRHTVLMIDEAQNLDISALEELRMLSNINADGAQLLQVILVGQPQLRVMLQRPELAQFAQRITSDFHLGPLTVDEATQYIQHRLSLSGAAENLFSKEAAHMIATCEQRHSPDHQRRLRRGPRLRFCPARQKNHHQHCPGSVWATATSSGWCRCVRRGRRDWSINPSRAQKSDCGFTAVAYDDVMLPPRQDIAPNTADYETLPLVKASGFREYDARWLIGSEINALGFRALGLGLGTLLHARGVKPHIVVGHDYRSYSMDVKNALITGLLGAGCTVYDIGLAMTPMAYFAQFDLDVPAVAMVTASHNENGWTGVKMGMERPFTFSPDEMTALKDIVLGGKWEERGGGRLIDALGRGSALRR